MHHNFFKNRFEWAGQTRNLSFTFANGSTTFTQVIKEKELTKPFTAGREVQRKLTKLNKMLVEKNNLKDLTRQASV
ncbi:hypothetical protein AT246_03710 [Bartonella henselae]|uniref:BepI protein n=1 Tax=Bartonella henselae TaxID=38323 RepID=X5M5U2_BARHN|nr:hypothetical protein AT243_04145 [Bartonella henselae]OLL50602.1 hypothetical protein AT247_05735 [Bartonella henselae]OLL51972.1 hypothetical protein AT241_04545 [Bartonella henselae]OLL54683.1 hypothetical protein AT238_05345 [Bartonella henselae]OLL58986.1 hypothetical protein AT246_03710 [Bartonella henselae]